MLRFGLGSYISLIKESNSTIITDRSNLRTSPMQQLQSPNQRISRCEESSTSEPSASLVLRLIASRSPPTSLSSHTGKHDEQCEGCSTGQNQGTQFLEATAVGEHRMKAVEEGNIIITSDKLDRGIGISVHRAYKSMLHVVIKRGDTSMVRILLDRGADKEAETTFGIVPLHKVVYGSHEDIVRLLMAVVQILRLDETALMDERHCTLLYHATAWGDYQVISCSWCRTRGPNHDGQYSIVNRCMEQQGRNFVVSIHMQRQSGSQSYFGKSAWHIAACLGYAPIVRLLLHYGAKADINDNDGGIPLNRQPMSIALITTKEFATATCVWH
ncbi:ankyrin repeat-containing domain protein [Trichophaea hybrida]|nr:ankyrin repeat-containing domain protein [Trichophaea hybrida]